MSHKTIKNLRQRWVLVTGAASGIGRATALAFARAGANLIICDLNEEGLLPVSQAVERCGVSCIAQRVDVSDAQALLTLAEQLPVLDVLVNNAGIGYLGPFLGTPTSAWKRVLEINVMGAVHGCQAFLPRMLAAGGTRRIVNVASLAGIAAAPNMSAYAASKFALIGLSEALTIELELQQSSIGITTVCPGIVNTAITESKSNISSATSAEQMVRLQAYYKAMGVSPEMVADAIVAAVHSARELVLVGKFARPLYHLRRLSRRLARWLMRRDAAKAGYV